MGNKKQSARQRFRRSRRGAVVAAMMGTTALVAMPAMAADFWTGANSSDWHDDGNWLDGSEPTAADVTTIEGAVTAALDGAAGEASSVAVGGAEAGSLLIHGDGWLFTSDAAAVGNGAGGTATITGEGAYWYIGGSLGVGTTGDGTLEILDGSRVDNLGAAYIGLIAGSSGEVTVSGELSTWNSSDTLNVGYEGSGTLNIQDGGLVSVSNGSLLRIGAIADGTGSVLVDGVNARLLVDEQIYVGYLGDGTITVSDGGLVTNTETTIGYGVNTTGTALVSGVDSSWQSSADFIVGHFGSGSLTIEGGGSVSNGDQGALGVEAGSVGTVVVTGDGSVWTTGNGLIVGYEGEGDLSILDGGTVEATNGGDVGIGLAGVGAVLVSDTGSALQADGSILVGYFGDGELTLVEGGTASAGLVWLASDAGATGTLNIGNGGAAGLLDATEIQFGFGEGVINFNHTESDYTFSADIIDTQSVGSINHLAGVTRITGDGSVFGGTTTISGGTLIVDSTLAGTLGVTGGTLGGSGAVGDVTIADGGTIAPGNSVGTLNVVSATFDTGSTYEVELNDGGFAAGTNNDLLHADGSVTINGGTVFVTAENGTDDGSTYSAGTYTIITADGGVLGEFDDLTEDFAFLNFSLSYDAGNVFLDSEQVTSFCLEGMTANQCATGDGVFSLGNGNLFNAVLNLPEADAADALDQLSGEIHASAGTVLIEDSHFVRDAANDRLRADMAYALPGEDHGVGVWGQAFGAVAHSASDGNAAAMDRSTGGVLAGADAFVSDSLRLGLLGGFSRSGLSVDDRASSGSASTWHLGVYAGGEWDNFSLRGGAAYSWHNIETSRSVDFIGFSDALAASYNAATAQAFAEAGYRVDAGAFSFEPYGAIAHVQVATDGFTESGGDAALTGSQSVLNSTFTTLGLRGETEVYLDGETSARLTGGIGWRHAFGSATPGAEMAFAGGDVFSISGVPMARDALMLDLGANVALSPAATLDLSYSGQIASGISEHGVKASFSVSF